MSLLALKRPHTPAQESDLRGSNSHRLRLLIAANCQNATFHGLAEALKSFPNLTYLDLSNTSAARDQTLLARLSGLLLLQVLKIRNVHLRDEDLDVLANAIGTRVRSLDISQNHLSDRSVQTLLEHCFINDHPEASSVARRDPTFYLEMEDWPTGIVRPDPTTLDEFRDESHDRKFVQRLTSAIVSRLPFEDFPDSGITHLSVADNDISVRGLAALVRSKKLLFFNAGSPDPRTYAQQAGNHPSEFQEENSQSSGHNPGLGSIVPILERYAPEMTYLRVDHTAVTEVAPSTGNSLRFLASEFDAQEQELAVEAEAHELIELDEVAPSYEVDTQDLVPRYELPSDPLQIVVSPPVGEKPRASPSEHEPTPKRGSVFAPEVEKLVEGKANIATEVSAVLTATGIGAMAQSINGVEASKINLPLRPHDSIADNLESRILSVQRQREELRILQKSKPHGLVPAKLPHLRTLVLTDVPSISNTHKVVHALISFIKYCASEANLASLEANLVLMTDNRSSFNRQESMHRRKAREIFTLKQIILEMAAVDTTDMCATEAVPYRQRKSKFSNRTKSSTEDADSEAFWSASEHDFTFFDDEEECGIPAAETSSQSNIPFAAPSEKMVSVQSERTISQLSNGVSSHVKVKAFLPSVDVIQEIARFRRERKAAFEEVSRKGLKFVEGHWPGEVKVVRAQRLSSSSTDGMIDYYGNFFERG